MNFNGNTLTVLFRDKTYNYITRTVINDACYFDGFRDKPNSENIERKYREVSPNAKYIKTNVYKLIK